MVSFVQRGSTVFDYIIYMETYHITTKVRTSGRAVVDTDTLA